MVIGRMCDTNEVMAALAYLRATFGGYGIPEAEERSHMRTFRRSTPQEVTDAIEACKVNARRPAPAEIESIIRSRRRRAALDATPTPIVDETDRTPPEEVPARVAALREQIGRRP